MSPADQPATSPDRLATHLKAVAGSTISSSSTPRGRNQRERIAMHLNVRTWGPKGAPECLLLHGITSSAGSWASLGPELAGRGLRAIAPELRGHGESSRGGAYDTATLVQDLVESAPAQSALVIGHSFGGYLAQWAILRGVLRPRSILLEDPVSVQPNRESPLASLDADQYGIERSVDGVLLREPRWTRVDAAWKILSLEQVDWDGARQAFAANAPWDLRGDAPAVARQAPIRWVVPGASRFVPEPDVNALRLTVGNGHVTVVPEVGHSIHRDNLPLFMSIVDELLSEAGIRP